MYSNYRKDELYYPFHSFKKSNLKKSTMKQMLKDVEKYDLASCDFENYVNVASSMILKHYKRKNISVLHTNINYVDIFKQHENYEDYHDQKNIGLNTKKIKKERLQKMFDTVECAWYDRNQRFKQEILFNKINKDMLQGKLIYIYLDLENYTIEKENEDDNGVIDSHSSSLILYPSKKHTGNNMIKTYSVYHFNPHGTDTVYDHEYEIYISRKRSKSIDLEVGVDRYVINKMVEAYNHYTEVYDNKFVSLYYDITKRHNYTSANLQISDEYGICYIYPFLLFNEIATKYNESYEFQHFRRRFSRNIPSYKTLIQKEDINTLIFVVLSKYFKTIKFKYLEFIEQTDYSLIKIPSTHVTEKEDNFDIEIEGLINENKEHYRYIHYMYMNYLLQPLFKKKALRLIDYDEEV